LPSTFNAGVPSPLFMVVFCVVVFRSAYPTIAFRGVGGTTGVNAAINVIQIVALIAFFRSWRSTIEWGTLKDPRLVGR